MSVGGIRGQSGMFGRLTFPVMSTDCKTNGVVEETFIWLLKFANIKQIKAFLAKNQPMFLHYPTSDLRTPLTTVIDRGDPQIMSLLLDKNSTPLDETFTQPCGRTALMYASFVTKSPEILQVLLKKGANAHQTDIRGWSCLQYAVIGERPKNVSFLLDYGVSVNQRDLEQRTPLMIAVHLSSVEILLLLLANGADIEARDKEGFTALQLAILWRKRDAAITLIEKGSDISVVTPFTRTSVGELCKTTMPNILRCIEEKR